MKAEVLTSLERWLEDSRVWIEAGLRELVPSPEEHPVSLHEAMQTKVADRVI